MMWNLQKHPLGGAIGSLKHTLICMLQRYIGANKVT